MFGEITHALARPEEFAWVWRDGELYLDLLLPLVPTAECVPQQGCEPHEHSLHA